MNKKHKPQIFISYSHKDEEFKNKLEKKLNVLQREGNFEVWTDREIGEGDEWLLEIEEKLNTCDVAVLLISDDFLTSDFISSKEVPLFLNRKNNHGLKLFPVIIDDTPWEKIGWLSKLEGAMKDNIPIQSDKEQVGKKLTELVNKIDDYCQKCYISTQKNNVTNIEYNTSKKHETFIDCMYESCTFNKTFEYNNIFKRKLDQPQSRKMFQRNLLTILLTENDLKLYESMINLISNHTFSPHEPYVGNNYYVQIESNERIMDNYLKKIISNNIVEPYFHIGSRGSGKTLLQNIWLKNNYDLIEEKKIFHIRCDVHKIYYLMKKIKYKSNYKKLKIETYLDIQFIYIFLKYRDKKYNNKGNNGAVSQLMRSIEKELDLNYENIVQNSKFKNLGKFIDEQSKIIKHTEVNIRKEDTKYSYAIYLLGNETSDLMIKDIVVDYDGFIKSIKENKYNDKIEKLLGNFDKETKDLAIKKIKIKIKENKNEDTEIQISDMETTLLRINKELITKKQKTADLWLTVSRYIQKIILSKGYKILKMIDGIDNIVIEDAEEDKEFFKEKILEINNIIKYNETVGIYYFISLRDDTFETIKEVQGKIKIDKAGYNTGNIPDYNLPKYTDMYHSEADTILNKIITKRYKALNLSQNTNKYRDSLYASILFTVFNKNNNIKIMKINNIRMILRNYLFMSLQILHEFKRKGYSRFNENFCLILINRKFEETFFLRNKLYVSTGESINHIPEDMFKVFPNIFYTHLDSKNWAGLCRLRILQLLTNNKLHKKEIIEILKPIYPTEYIEKKINSVLSYNLTYTTFDNNTKSIKYRTSYKGKYLLSIIKSNLDILYYLSLDTLLPSKFVDTNDSSKESYFSIFRKTDTAKKNTGYSNSIIKTVFTFTLFIKHIHDTEISILTKNNANKEDIEKLKLPLDIKQISIKMRYIYNNKIENYDNLNSYFRYISKYNNTDINNKLISFSWLKQK